MRSGGDLHKRLADVETRDPTVAQPMLAPSQFPLTHDFDRQTQARFLRALGKSYLKADWNNIDLATVQLSRPCSFWQLQASCWVIGVQVLLSGVENPRLRIGLP